MLQLEIQRGQSIKDFESATKGLYVSGTYAIHQIKGDILVEVRLVTKRTTKKKPSFSNKGCSKDIYFAVIPRYCLNWTSTEIFAVLFSVSCLILAIFPTKKSDHSDQNIREQRTEIPHIPGADRRERRALPVRRRIAFSLIAFSHAHPPTRIFHPAARVYAPFYP